MTYVSLSAQEILALVGSIAAAFLLALPLGWERKTRSQAYVGLRVFPLVSVSACVFGILGQYLFTGQNVAEQSDVLQGLMTGIGFIGAGSIIKQADETHGLATAAAVWTTGAIGISVAYGYFVLAITLSLLSLFILEVMPWIRRGAQRVSRTRDRPED
jgi:putative Mg2+ transporter-C (MgtC) family protein